MRVNKMRRAPNPSWLKPEELQALGGFADRHGGSLRIHNHPKTIKRW